MTICDKCKNEDIINDKCKAGHWDFSFFNQMVVDSFNSRRKKAEIVNNNECEDFEHMTYIPGDD